MARPLVPEGAGTSTRAMSNPFSSTVYRPALVTAMMLPLTSSSMSSTPALLSMRVTSRKTVEVPAKGSMRKIVLRSWARKVQSRSSFKTLLQLSSM